MLMARVLKSKNEKAQEVYREKAAVIAEKLDELHALEERTKEEGTRKEAAGSAPSSNSPAALLDRAGGIFGELMAEVFDYRKDMWSPALRNTGYYLGKFIYILDAYDDLEKDMRTGSFNPLAQLHGRPDLDSYVRGILTMTVSECSAAFETLPIVENADILRNILYSGIWSKFEERVRKNAGAEQNPPDGLNNNTERTAQDE